MGLTGGIGAGKSTVAERLVELGAVLIDSDILAREVIAPGTAGLARVAETFGTGVVDPAGGLDRQAMAELVFADPGARARLEGIIHPLVRRRSAELAAAAAADAIVVNDVPLLVEVGLAPTFDLVVVVEAPRTVRLERLTARGLPAEQAAARINAQTSDEARRVAADAVIDNSGDLDRIRAAVDLLWRDRLIPFEDNKRLRQLVRRSNALRIAASDPAWPRRFDRLAARLARIAGDTAIAIDHVGSTAVPGLAAKDVIDIQLTVADMDHADALAEPLARAGFPRLEQIRRDNPKPWAPDPADWAKRFHGGTDPAEVTHIHLRAQGSAGWRYALAFRDFLRADPATLAEYQALKLRLAAESGTTDDYADAKEPWFDKVLPRLDAWIAESGWRPPTAT